ncbi:hypothetical protein NDU88_005278 [Pleurodeles waltl]|uniref:Uncharacterized protein n=1 Tax=Pleurodeles waltl TaxID=8319 RepID=A0AAV7SL63_PLEWA|nr:hypothetical protein NDU88_005278 [Pleurodeles waltl]
METWLGSLAEEISFMCIDHHKLADEVTYGEKTLSALHPLADDNWAVIRDLHEHARYLEDRAEDAAGCSQISNVQILGLQEGIEEQDPILHLET